MRLSASPVKQTCPAAKNGMQMRQVDLTNFDNMNYASLILRPNDVVYVQPNEWKKFKVASDDYTSTFVTVAKLAAPFVTLNIFLMIK